MHMAFLTVNLTLTLKRGVARRPVEQKLILNHLCILLSRRINRRDSEKKLDLFLNSRVYKLWFVCSKSSSPHANQVESTYLDALDRCILHF